MKPHQSDAEDYSRSSWGGGLRVVAPVPQLWDIFAFNGGLEITNFLTETKEFRDRTTGLRTEQQTSQDYWRFYLGGQIGGHGRGFLRPHAGVNLALVHYRIDTDVVIPDDFPGDDDDEIRQEFRRESHTTWGYDFTLGMDFNIINKVPVDVGVRYIKSFNLPQQLGEGSEKIHPEYFQIYLGVGVSFGVFRDLDKSDDEDTGSWYEDS
jgi:opacity protein-like surface antigen